MLAHRPARRLRTAATAIAAAVLLSSGASGTATAGPPHPGPAHGGKLLTSQPLTTTAALPSAARTELITYMSSDAHGRPIVVSGTVAVPSSPPPPSGWPVISWAHGTTGYADPCAPSRDTSTGPVHDYLGRVTDVLDTWIQRGFAVVHTDYQGLGTPGGHPYINGISEANTVTDIVRAARSADRSIGRDWIAVGHSQGGQAALFTAQYARNRQPELSLKGAVAIAPGGIDLSRMVEFVDSGGPGAEAAAAFVPLIVLGAQAAEPAIDPDRLFTPAAEPLVQAARTGCLAQIREVPPVPPTEIFEPDADFAALTGYLEAQDPSDTQPEVPVMIAQGTADALVTKPSTDALVDALCGRGTDLRYRVYEGRDHRATIPASLVDTREFVTAVLTGQHPPGSCAD
ncbi:lipase family protein [Nocardia sp. NPDC024068]|uniref:lipase family protein n=1 Tax=Nocardia sp. NPDC024068 TaxID=3157197 RepID=UPI00340C7AC0